MTIHNSTKVKDPVNLGMEKGFPESDETNDFLPREISSSEDVEDVFDFLSESDIDIVEMIQGEGWVTQGREHGRGRGRKVTFGNSR